jgi:hypothetical protein
LYDNSFGETKPILSLTLCSSFETFEAPIFMQYFDWQSLANSGNPANTSMLGDVVLSTLEVKSPRK